MPINVENKPIRHILSSKRFKKVSHINVCLYFALKLKIGTKKEPQKSVTLFFAILYYYTGIIYICNKKRAIN